MSPKRKPPKMGFEHQHRREPRPRWTRSPAETAPIAAGQPRYRYRIICFDRPVTGWLHSIEDMQRAAIAGRYGSACEQTHMLFMSVPYWIQSEKLER